MYFSRVQLKPEIHRTSQLSYVLSKNSYGLHQLLWDLFPEDEERSFIFREEISKEQLSNQQRGKGSSLFYVVSKHEPLDESPIFQVVCKKYAPVINKGQRFAFKLRANPIIAKKTHGKKHSMRHDVVMDAQRSLLCDLARLLAISNADNMKKSVLRHLVFNTWKGSDNLACSEQLCEIIRANERFEQLMENDLSSGQLLDWALKIAADSALEVWLKKKGVQNGFGLVSEDCGEGIKRLKFQAESYRWHAMPKKGRDAGFSSVDFDGVIQVLDPDIFQGMLFNGVGPAKAFGCGLMLIRRM
jgi:CRISPR system Cascade subunit CasE